MAQKKTKKETKKTTTKKKKKLATEEVKQETAEKLEAKASETKVKAKKTRKKAAEPKVKAEKPAKKTTKKKSKKSEAAQVVKEEKVEVKQPVQPKPVPQPVYEEPPKVKAPPPKPEPAAPQKPQIKGEIRINEMTTVKEIAEKMNVKVTDIIKKLISMGSLATINQRIDLDVAELLAEEYHYKVKFVSICGEEAVAEVKENEGNLKPRPPVVTIMGHVDHGKTSVLDIVRKANVVAGEAGGITQHIGAYKVKLKEGEIVFLDTPGHEAFTEMRSRGAKATDIVVLVVSSADGVMPQTVEAINHATAANVPIIVAINKIDLPTSNPQQVKQELSKYNLVSEDWGGDTIMVEVSARNNINIDKLLEMILLKAEMMELKANPDRCAAGVVVEARLDPRKGTVATVLIQSGTLRVGDNFVVGMTCGKVRAMSDEFGKKLEVVPPSTPVELLGFSATPLAGDKFTVVATEREAREIAQTRQSKAKEEAFRPRHHLSLEDISSGKVKELRIILKADVQGSAVAIKDSLEKISTSEITLKIIHAAVGGINESDVNLAAASDALIIGFNIRPEPVAEKLAEKEGVSIRCYRIIYEIINEVKSAMEGLLEPTLKETTVGKAQVRQTFRVSKVGTVAGTMVMEGKVQRNSKARLLRDNVVVYQGSVCSLFRFKDDVKEVDKGYECGIGLDRYSDIRVGDLIECFTVEKISRKLD